jgi:hypothetical protein
MRAPPARMSTHDRIGRLSARHLVVGLSQHPQSVDVVGPPGGFQRRDVVLALPVLVRVRLRCVSASRRSRRSGL